MSYLDSQLGRYKFITEPEREFSYRAPGCVQCGCSLEAGAGGKIDAASKCYNCLGWVSDEDELVEDLED